MADTSDFFGEFETGMDKTPEPEGIVQMADPLALHIEDKVLVNTVDDLIRDSRAFFEKKDLGKRRAKNVEYYLGRQIERLEKKNEYKPHNARFSDNLIWEGEATLKPIALSRIPDLIVKPGNESEESKKIADQITDVINADLRKRENRIVLGRAYRHRPLYFIGCIKYRWNPEKGRLGDYEFDCVHPESIDVDHTATDNDVNKMRWIAHHYELTVKEVIMRFPNKKDRLIKELDWDKSEVDNERKLASKIKLSEVWFTWYVEKTEEGKKKWQREEGVLWKYKKLLLDKMRNPNWDWEGEEQLFSYDENKQERVKVGEEQFRNALSFGQEIPNLFTEKVYHNHFENPEKPFILIGYDQLGLQPYDETSRIEQVIYLQENVDKRGKQITELADGARGKLVFSTESGLDKTMIEQIDMSNPYQDILVEGSLREVFTHIPGVQPSAALFEDKQQNVERVFAKMGAHATTRGEREANETATGRQILREADYGKQDDEVEDTINYAAERMANAAMQMIKLRYTEEHMRRLLGKDSSVVFVSISRDFIEDGMDVEVSASGVDKIRRRAEANNRASIQMTDPLSYFEDTDTPDPKGRTERLLLFQLNPEMYFSKYVMGLENTQQMAGAIGGNGQAQTGRSNAVMAIAQLQRGQRPQPPTNVDAEYINTINQFLQTPEFQGLPPNAKENARQFATQLVQVAREGGGAGAMGG